MRRANFTVARDPKQAVIGGDEFTAPAVISAIVLGELLDKLAEIQTVSARLDDVDASRSETMKQLILLSEQALSLVLLPESAQRFTARLYDPSRPFDLIGEVLPAAAWLAGEYVGSSCSDTNVSTSTVDATADV